MIPPGLKCPGGTADTGCIAKGESVGSSVTDGREVLFSVDDLKQGLRN